MTDEPTSVFSRCPLRFLSAARGNHTALLSLQTYNKVISGTENSILLNHPLMVLLILFLNCKICHTYRRVYEMYAYNFKNNHNENTHGTRNGALPADEKPPCVLLQWLFLCTLSLPSPSQGNHYPDIYSSAST